MSLSGSSLTVLNPNPYYDNDSIQGNWSDVNPKKTIVPQGPWCYLDPNDSSQWWKKHHIVDSTKFIAKKNQYNILAYFIIQDTSLTGEKWHLSYWYYNDPNRYVQTINEWIFTSKLTNLKNKDAVHLISSILEFTVYDCKFVEKSQNKFCKIFIRRKQDGSDNI